MQWERKKFCRVFQHVSVIVSTGEISLLQRHRMLKVLASSQMFSKTIYLQLYTETILTLLFDVFESVCKFYLLFSSKVDHFGCTHVITPDGCYIARRYLWMNLYCSKMLDCHNVYESWLNVSRNIFCISQRTQWESKPTHMSSACIPWFVCTSFLFLDSASFSWEMRRARKKRNPSHIWAKKQNLNRFRSKKLSVIQC